MVKTISTSLPLCNICLNTCYFPCKLDMDCNCTFITHPKCYYTWWKEHRTCIICKEYSKDPFYTHRINMQNKEINILALLCSIFITICIIFLSYK